MPFEILRNDITNMHVDAIVNTANPRPVIGSGVDAAIHAKAGPKLLEARKKIGTIYTGEACITPGFNLPAKYVIHTVGPVWKDGNHGETYLLRQCYEHSLKLAWRHRLNSVAVPLLSSGNYGFPKKLALSIAVEAISKFLEKYDMMIYLVVFHKESFEISETLVRNVRSFIDERYAQEKAKVEYSFSISREYDQVQRAFGEWEKKQEDFGYEIDDRVMSSGDSLEVDELSDIYNEGDYYRIPKAKFEVLKEKYLRALKADKQNIPKGFFNAKDLKQKVKSADAGFSETLLKLIDQSGKKDSDIYKKANIDRKLFSKIRNNPAYKPTKATALAFAIALELDLEETKDLIGRAGYALSKSSEFDIIIEYFIIHERYDLYEINMTLFEFDQSLLGA